MKLIQADNYFLVLHEMAKAGMNEEREFVYFLIDQGYAACRIAGSGSMPIDLPDVIGGKKGKILASEVKSTKKKAKYFTKEEIKALIRFTEAFGAKPIASVKFKRKAWKYYNIEDLEETKKSFKADYEKGKEFDEISK